MVSMFFLGRKRADIESEKEMSDDEEHEGKGRKYSKTNTGMIDSESQQPTGDEEGEDWR